MAFFNSTDAYTTHTFWSQNNFEINLFGNIEVFFELIL